MDGKLRDSVIGRQRDSVGSGGYRPDMGIGRRLQERRRELRLSVKDVAARAGMAPTTLYDLEREEQHSTTRLHSICKVLGLQVEWVESERGPRLVGKHDRNSARPADADARVTLHGMQISADEVEVGIEWGKLQEPTRTLIRDQVYLMVADQVRKERVAAKDRPPDRPHKRN